MANYRQLLSQKELEILFGDTEDKKKQTTNISSILKKFWQHVLIAITQGQEPRVWQHNDYSGKTWWYGYDPVTERSICVDSEAEMRIWLEERYYQ